MITTETTSTLLRFLLINGVWLFLLGLLLWRVGRRRPQRAAFWHLLWVVLLAKMLLPPAVSVGIGIWDSGIAEQTAEQSVRYQEPKMSGSAEPEVQNAGFRDNEQPQRPVVIL